MITVMTKESIGTVRAQKRSQAKISEGLLEWGTFGLNLANKARARSCHLTRVRRNKAARKRALTGRLHNHLLMKNPCEPWVGASIPGSRPTSAMNLWLTLRRHCLWTSGPNTGLPAV